MSRHNRQGDWGEYTDRARQPLGPGVAAQRRGRAQQKRREAPRAYPQTPPDAAPNSGYREPASIGPRSRKVAILVLVVAAVIVIIGGVAASGRGGSSGSGATVSVSILPFPQSPGTTLAQ